jgi:hypothetical protein
MVSILFELQTQDQTFVFILTSHKFFACQDLSYGSEHVPVPCVNCVDHTVPEYVNYSTKREPTDGVHLNLDPEFLIGCECTDDCQVSSCVIDMLQLIDTRVGISVFNIVISTVPCELRVCAFAHLVRCARAPLAVLHAYYRSAQAKILEFYPAQPEDHLARARSLSSNMLPVLTQTRLHFVQVRMKPNLLTIFPDYHIINTCFFPCVNASNP